jgi:poly-gamma-glutamate capsule biosynthesis protein CapA/YwtB (metallophosphatase superfamily)
MTTRPSHVFRRRSALSPTLLVCAFTVLALLSPGLVARAFADPLASDARILVVADPGLLGVARLALLRASTVTSLPVDLTSAPGTATPDLVISTETSLHAPVARTASRLAYVPVAHFACPADSVSLAALRAAFSGRAVYVPGSRPRRRLLPVLSRTAVGPDPSALAALGLTASRGVRLAADEAAALAFAARTPGAVALVPLSRADVRVRTLAVSGRDPLALAGRLPYPVARALTLEWSPPTTDAAAEVRRQSEIGALFAALAARFASPVPVHNLSLVAVGDMMLSRNVGSAMAATGDWLLPFRSTRSLLSAGDITFGNLESPFSDVPFSGADRMSFRAAPRAVAGLTWAGFDVVSLANNHFGNGGSHGMRYTFSLLKRRGIAYCGAGMNVADAHRPAIVARHGLRVAFLSYNDIEPFGYAAGRGAPGTAWMSSPRVIAADIALARRSADLVVVSYHWGTEYTPYPTARQRAFGRLAIDRGADIVLSQHPHVVQSLEWRHGKLIAYSLGNFVFDQMWSQETREGLIGRVSVVGGRVAGVRLTPTLIYGGGRPRVAGRTDAARILGRVWRASRVKRW